MPAVPDEAHKQIEEAPHTVVREIADRHRAGVAESGFRAHPFLVFRVGRVRQITPYFSGRTLASVYPHQCAVQTDSGALMPAWARSLATSNGARGLA
jgi:hypothetical protein